MNIMLSPMNHREIEYTTRKYWKEQQIEEKDVSNLFCEWENEAEREATTNLMDWLEQTQKEVFQEDLLLDYGADCLRLYLMFEKTPEPNDTWLDTWEECNLEGCYKFLGRFRRMILVADYANGLGLYQGVDTDGMKKKIYQMQQETLQYIAKGNSMPNRHNAISVIMEGMKQLQKELRIGEMVTSMHSHEIAMAVPHGQKQEETNVKKQQKTGSKEVDIILEELLLLFSPFAPVLTEHLWQRIHVNSASVFQNRWKMHKVEQKRIKLPIQVNAKTKKVIDISSNATQEEVEEVAKQELSQLLQGKEYQAIYVPGKIINFVIKQ